MSVHINGEPKEFLEPLSVSELLKKLNSSSLYVAIAVNQTVIPPSEFSTTQISDLDHIEILTPTPGG
ncbi:MAG: thiamine biosynthesis protein ThiS [Deltaproteobacteria bacterium RIFCSPLOWO2_12_FULL_40_28]|nr:MAG: thiamine biosynthesis protein ThiS [Deltaproteobacteria bacterium RIFCSPHIGHO2_02_FULL_40_28]OGQ19796.1 MAG: thiamine biosynthesis protein ThiS [Deltaproteobacteria bacterium RIFCSPHIGHO2_12_FULL_40_32]OGQ41079.1 MAG: thiamine biosynthesis protein ThiS [Deltaproteobacteria bacterium RIFCSPLOWO2_02_FULL_40_36]OGQ54196.1 MAG: thiamine biosynthesis protein ThiS [Deltaproteobacteria bacterium RIFCSPLOWO2_12_FULL_40_28]